MEEESYREGVRVRESGEMREEGAKTVEQLTNLCESRVT